MGVNYCIDLSFHRANITTFYLSDGDGLGGKVSNDNQSKLKSERNIYFSRAMEDGLITDCNKSRNQVRV